MLGTKAIPLSPAHTSLGTLEDGNYAFCVEGQGITLPEDVGGAFGCEQFLWIIADEDDPDREHMMAWVKSQGYKEFDIEMANRMLRFYK